MGSRREALEGLLDLMHSRTADFDGLMRSFTGLLGDSFQQAEARAREIGTFLADTSQATSSTIAAQFEGIRSATNNERERTAAAMRAAYEQANGEMTTLFGHAADRFQTAAAELRGMTAEIHQELEATRHELRRGVIDFPKEAAQHADHIREVVGNQIRALNELNEIVARTGRRNDVALPIAPQASLAAPLPAPVPAPVVVAPPAPQHDPVPVQAASPALAPSPPPMPRPAAPERSPPRLPERPAPAEGFTYLRAPPSPPAPVRAPAPQPAAAPPPAPVAASVAPPPRPPAERAPVERVQAERGPGWLSDLLARASTDDVAPPPPLPRAAPAVAAPPPAEQASASNVDQLDRISLDIARMIDHDAAVELWERYREGERNVFSRRLYTAHGQQTFDEIRRRHRADPEFRDTVDRYTHEFERLLNEIGPDDPDGALARGYLTSETGKVYTMLAHAAGRFD